MPNVSQASIAANIRSAMKRAKIRQHSVVVNTGFTTQQVSDMLSGRKVIRAEYLPVLATAVEATPQELLTGIEEEEKCITT